MNKFKRINLEITTACNLSCSFCPYSAKQNERAIHLSPEQFSTIARQAKPLTEQLTLHLLGEPLAHPQLEEILACAQEIAIPVEITTNGILIEKKRSALLAATALKQINFSLQSYIDNFPQQDILPYLNGLLQFTKELHDASPDVYVNFRWWLNPGHEKQFEIIISRLEAFFDVAISRAFSVDSIKSKRIWERVYLHFDSRFDWPSEKGDFISDKGRCYALSTHIGIHADGTVVPCCLDVDKVLSLGNCLETPLDRILTVPRAVNMRDGFLRGELREALCQRCSFIQRFDKKKGSSGKNRQK